MEQMKPSILQDKTFILVGSVFYGDIGQPWSTKNQIGQLWDRFMKLMDNYAPFLEKIGIDPAYGYELHLETEEYEQTNQYYVMVGIEVLNTDQIPLEMFIKNLPTTDYVKYTVKVQQRAQSAEIYNTWLPEHNYVQSFPFILQGYHSKRFFGLNDPKSEIDWYIPIKKKLE